MPEAMPKIQRLPGQAQSQTAAMRKYTEAMRERRENLHPDTPDCLHSFFFPDPEKIYRWRIQLDCGCISETWTYFGQGENKPPTQFEDVHGRPLPEGEHLCGCGGGGDWPYREIVKWGPLLISTFERVPGSDGLRMNEVQKIETLEVEPEEPQRGYTKELWDIIRRTEAETVAYWTVTLSCGHQDTVQTDADWKPSDAPRLRGKVKEGRELQDFLIRVEEDASRYRERMSDPTAEFLSQHEIEHLIKGSPNPDPESQCHTCILAHSIVAYERVGWLKPPPKPPAPPTPEEVAEKATKKAQQRDRRIKNLEAELAQLRAEQEN